MTLQHQNASQQRPFYGYSLGQLTSAPEAIYWSKSAPMYQSQGGWNSPVTSKLLFEAGVLYNNKDYPTHAAAGQRAESGGVLAIPAPDSAGATTATPTATTPATISTRGSRRRT